MKNLSFLFHTCLFLLLGFSSFAQQNFLYPDVEENYLIESQLQQDAVLFAKTYHGNLGLQRSSNENDRQFKFVDAGGGFFRIQSRAYSHPAKFLTVSGEGKYVIFKTNTWSNDQKFRLRYKGGGWVEIVSAQGHNLVLTVDQPHYPLGSNIKTSYANGGTQQKFRLIRTTIPSYSQLGHQQYLLGTKLKKDLVLDVTSGHLYPNNNIQLWTNYNKRAQKFTLRQSNHNYKFISALSNPHGQKFVLGMKDSHLYKGKNVSIQADKHYAPEQEFVIISANNKGYFYIIAANSRFALDIPNGNAYNGANVQLWQKYQVNAQQFKFIEDIDKRNAAPNYN